MSVVYDWPAAWAAQAFEAQLVPAVRRFDSPYGGSSQAVDLLGERWRFAVQIPARTHADAAAVEAYVARLRGPANRVRLWHMLRPVPRGTMRGSPVLAAGAAQGADELSITTTAGATVLAGDMLGLGTMLLQVAEDATANGAGAITVPLSTRLRTGASGGAAVAWSKPTALFTLADSAGMPLRYTPGIASGLMFELLEVW